MPRPVLAGPALTKSRACFLFAEFADVVGQNFCEICGVFSEIYRKLSDWGLTHRGLVLRRFDGILRHFADCFSGFLRNFADFLRNVADCLRNFAELLRNVADLLRNFAEFCGLFAESLNPNRLNPNRTTADIVVSHHLGRRGGASSRTWPRSWLCSRSWETWTSFWGHSGVMLGTLGKSQGPFGEAWATWVFLGGQFGIHVGESWCACLGNACHVGER